MHTLKRIGWMVIVVALLLSVVPRVAAQSTVTATSAATMRLRSGPSTGYRTLVILPRGQTVPVLGRTADRSWLAVSYEGQPGWAFGSLLTVTGDVSAVPVISDLADLSAPAPAPPTAATLQPAAPTLSVTTTANLRFRAGPGTHTAINGLVPRGTTLPPTGRNASASWVQVPYQGRTGWLSVAYLSITGDVAALPVVTAGAPTSANPPAPAAAPSTGPAAAQAAATQPLKAAPDQAARTLGVVQYEDTLTVSAISPDGQWLAVTHGTQPGWIATQYAAIDARLLAGLPQSTQSYLPPNAGPDPRHTNTTGYADVQIMIHWNTTANIALEVIDPQGNLITPELRSAPSGGYYEHLINKDCQNLQSAPVETVTWGPGGAPTGTYQITATYRNECLGEGETLFWISIRNNNVEEFWQWANLTPGDTVQVTFTR